ncbi:MarR family winged helix-turn-helix transcriptional regulator [Schaalia sp. Marseille-Q2122]|uniref:MarR family winged helix-turn-helix transcriptional regulator n=1 Tax=Schaalia sp. Marseille-Q2122 TaxID=2736604 RepID=UPI00158EA230|nr:MarR family transcriptional regulator [Schaalia sp. Marseille-Q2122]
MTQHQDWDAWQSYLFTASRILAGAEADLQARAQIGLSDYDVLISLYHAPQHQLSMSCLKETVLVTTSGLSRSVSRMSQRGWVTKETSPEDRRKVSLALTPEGLAAIEAIRPHHHEYVREHFFDALSAKDQQALGLALAHLSDHLTS